MVTRENFGVGECEGFGWGGALWEVGQRGGARRGREYES